jgi:hypothetical protein
MKQRVRSRRQGQCCRVSKSSKLSAASSIVDGNDKALYLRTGSSSEGLFASRHNLPEINHVLRGENNAEVI